MEFKKFLEMVNESESTAEKDDKAAAAGKKVTKDIEYDEGHIGDDDEHAEKAGKKVAADIRYDDKKDKKKSLKEYFEETEQEILNEGQFPIPVVGPDNKPIAGQSGFLNVSVPGQAGVAVDDMLRRLGARGLSIILPPNRIQQQQQQQALAAAKRASVQTSGQKVAEESVEEGVDDVFKLGAKYGDDITKQFKNFASGFKNPQGAMNLPNQPLASKVGAGTSRTGPALGALGGAGVAATAGDDKPAAVAADNKPAAAAAAPEAPATPAEPVAPVAPTVDTAPPAPPSDEVDRIQQLAGMSDEEKYGKVGAEIRRLDPEAYKNRPRDYQGNIDLLNKLRAQQAGDSSAPADGEKPADAKADEKSEQSADAADELEPVTVTGKRTQPADQDKEGDAELGRLLNLSGANTYDELGTWLKNRDKPVDNTEEPKASEPKTQPEEPAVDAAGEEPNVDAAGEEPAAAAATEPKTSYRVVDPSTGRARNVSKEKYDQMVARGQIDKDKGLDYQFKVRDPDGSIRTVKQGDPDWQRYADQAEKTVASNYNQLQGEPEDEEGEEKSGRPSLFRRLFNIGKDDEGYYLGKKRGRDNAPDEKSELSESKLVEKWEGDVKIDPTGEFKGKTKAQLQAMLAKLHKSGPHKKGSPEAKKQSQINFALRAKGGWKKGEGATMKEEKVDEKFASQQQAKLMHAVAGDKSVAKKTGVSQDVAKEFIKKSHGQKVSKLPKKVKEAEIPKSGPDYGAGLGAGRNDNVLEAKPDFLDLDKDGNKKESMKKAAADKKKKKVNESMSNLLKAAYSEGYVHGLREQPCRVKHYQDMEEAKHYFEGYKCGLEECYGLVPGRGYVDEETSQDVVDNMASFGAVGVEENTNQNMAAVPVQKAQAGQVNTSATNPAPQANVPVKSVATAMPQQPQMNVGGVATTKPDGSSNMSAVMQSRSNLSNMGQQAAQQQMQEDDLDEMDKGDWLKHKAQSTPGDTFKAFGQTFKDKDVKETFAFEDLENQLNALLTESKIVNEGLSVSMSTGQQGSPDSVSVTATDGDSEKLLAFIKQVGLGGLADKEEPVVTPAEPAVVATVSDYGAPKFSGHEMPSMDDLLSKLTGIESHDDHGHDHSHDHGEEETTCNECGMMESSCGCEKKTEEVLETQIDATVKSEQIDEAAPALAALGKLAGVAGKGLANVGRYALANPGKAAMVARIARDAWKNKNKDEVAETETLDQSEFMVAEDDGEGYEQSQADAGKIDSALALSGASTGGATNEDGMDSLMGATKGGLQGMGQGLGGLGGSMKNMMSKLGDIQNRSMSTNTSNDTSSYTVDGKPATKDEYDNAMKNFKMPKMPTMPNMPGGMELPDLASLGMGDDDNVSISRKEYDDLINAALPGVTVTGKRVGGDDELQPVTITSKKRELPGSDDELQPVTIQSKKREIPAGDDTLVAKADDPEMANIKKSLDDMIKDIMPRMVNRDQNWLDAQQGQQLATQAAAGDWFRSALGRGASLNDPNTRAKLDRLAKKSQTKEEKLDEWANDAGQKGTDAAFTRDTEFMTQTISGGLNKPKSTGQTTIPVIAGQEAREGDEDVQAWKKLAGLAK